MILQGQALTFGPIAFGAPAVLYGALAVAGPVLIHLMLRTQAKRVPLPTVRFVIKTQRQTRSAHRLKHLLLLLLRMLAIALLVGALAQPTLTTAAQSPGDRGPVEAILCLDDSASMAYRSQDQTAFERARRMAADLLRERRWLASGSRVAVLTGSLPSAAARTSLDLDYARQQVERFAVADHGRGLSRMLQQAHQLLEQAVLDAREVYVFTDLTQQAWRDIPPGTFGEREDVRVWVVDVGTKAPRNTALADPCVPDRPVPAGEAGSIRIGLESTHRTARQTLELLIEGKVRWRSGTIALSEGQRIEQVIPLEGLRPGLHQGRLRLLPNDALDADNERYISVHVGRGPAVALIAPDASPVGVVLEAMIAPRDLPESDRPYRLVRFDTARLPAQEAWDRYAAVVVADAPGLSKGLADSLGRFAQLGGHLLIVPGPSMTPADYAAARDLLPAVPVEIAEPAEPLHILPEAEGHPMLAPFGADSDLSLSEPALRQVVRFGPRSEQARVLATLDDGGPAILTRPVGRGATTVLAFAPVRSWGDLVVDAGPMLVLLHAFIEQGASRLCRAHHLPAGQPRRLPLPASPLPIASGGAWGADPPGGVASSGAGMVIRSAMHRVSHRAALTADGDALLAPADRNGNYVVAAQAQDDARYVAYSVNTPSAESDLRRLEGEAVRLRFGPDACRVVLDVAEITDQGGARSAERSLAGWFALLVLAAMLAEGLLSNRFHRRPAEEAVQTEVIGAEPAGRGS